MPTLSFLFFSGPYQSESAETTVELAKAALNKGVKVRIFAYMDAVNNAQTGQKKVPGVINLEEEFKEIIARGANVSLCTLCLLVRGTSNLIEGAKRGGTPEIADMLMESDRFLTVF